MKKVSKTEFEEFLKGYKRKLESNLFMDTYSWHDWSLGESAADIKTWVAKIEVNYDGDRDYYVKAVSDEHQV